MLAADDTSSANINGNANLCNWNNHATLAQCDVLPFLKPDLNIVIFTVINNLFGGGATFKLSVKSRI